MYPYKYKINEEGATIFQEEKKNIYRRAISEHGKKHDEEENDIESQSNQRRK